MKTLMIQGTSSHAGKSVIVAALLRVLKNRGINCAPFKPQNMALNSFVTYDGYEIGRAQAMQAEAAKISPSREMNPILLKPTTDSKAQVVVLGKPLKNVSAREYISLKRELKEVVKNSFKRLCEDYEVVIVEGAGSPAEINLRKNDIANMGFARMFDVPVLVVGDIDRGGIYASFYGTYALLTKKERQLLKGFLINKFRGDATLLDYANAFLERKTKIPILGVIPYFIDISLPDEDGVVLSDMKYSKNSGSKEQIRIRILKTPRISNFTDFAPLFMEEDIDVAYVSSVDDAKDAHVIILPGSKNTVEDLLFIKKNGFEDFLKIFVKKGGFLVGICGGYQMLGETVEDPYNIESPITTIDGLGFLPIKTVLEREKQLRQVTFESIDGSLKDMKGYEIHMGISECKRPAPVFIVCYKGNDKVYDGNTSYDGRVFGTYIHGLFDNDRFRLSWLNKIRKAYGFEEKKNTYSYEKYQDIAYNKLAEIFERSVNLKKIFSILGV